MYIEITIGPDDWSIQLKEEDGTDIGAPVVYGNDIYRLDRNIEMQMFIIQDANLPQDHTWPVVAAYPFSRTIVILEPL